jgi:adenylate cyclase class IV
MTLPLRETELKARVDDVAAARHNLEASGAILVFEGRLSDQIYDTPEGTLAAQDIVLRLRTYYEEAGVTAHLDWKGPTARDDGFKVRDELTTDISDANAMIAILTRLGYARARAVDRRIAQYELTGLGTEPVVTVRFEEYPRMDSLVEVEGTPAGIERAIRVLGMAREDFTADRLTDFVAAYERRTGNRGATSIEDCDTE